MSDLGNRDVDILERAEEKSYNAMGAILKSGKFREGMSNEEIHKLVTQAYDNPASLENPEADR